MSWQFYDKCKALVRLKASSLKLSISPLQVSQRAACKGSIYNIGHILALQLAKQAGRSADEELASVFQPRVLLSCASLVLSDRPCLRR